MTISTETLLLGAVVVSVSALLIAIMISVGDQHSRFGSAMRFALAAGMLALAVVYDVPLFLQQSYGIDAAGAAGLWMGAVVGAAVMTFGAVVQLAAWLRWGEGDRPLPSSPKADAREDAEEGAEPEKGQDGHPKPQ